MRRNCNTFSRIAIAVLTIILPFSTIKAEKSEPVRSFHKGWYAGVEGGMPFGFSTFSSFGHNKTYLGWSSGIYGGYHFNSVLSTEVSAKFGKFTISAQDCCTEHYYWLGSDGVMYKASVLGMEGWNYDDLKSGITMGQYGARLNVNLLGLFHKTRDSRWSLAVSPHVYAMSTKSSIQTISDNSDVQKNSTQWHMGYGADLQVGHQLTSCLQVGIYSGLTGLTGKRMDNMPKYLHKNNFTWESGVRLGFNFGCKKRQKSTDEPMPIPSTPQTTVQEKENVEPVKSSQPQDTTNRTTTKVVQQNVEKATKLTFPDIYFAFNTISNQQSELPKLNTILKLLEENPNINITVTGWCDAKGSVAINKRVSRQRAEAVKVWLTHHGVDEKRILVIGKGSDFNAQDPDKARRVETKNNNEE